MQSSKKKVFIGSDHAGFKLKEKIKSHLEKNNFQVEDLGPKRFKAGDDYPDYIIPTAKRVSKNKESMGIVIGASGQGEAIAANKVKGARAALYYGKNEEIIKLARQHNDANIISLGSKFLSTKKAIKALDLFLKTPFSNEQRHKRRIQKLEK
jgi:ribose 5-phosphate isomerase B